MNVKLILLFSLLMLANCSPKKVDYKQELNQETLTKLNLEELNISIVVPKNHNVINNKGKFSIDLNPNGRSIRTFTIKKLPSITQKSEFEESIVFKNGITFCYNTFVTEGGSGGVEYELEGVFKLKNQAYLVASSYQIEIGKAESQFCLKYLSTIELN